MTISWCQEHESQKWLDRKGGGNRCCWVMFEGLEITAQPCQYISVRLIPEGDRWFIEREQGQRVAGPFTTDDDANYARTWVETVLAPETFWIRHEASVSVK